MFKTPHGQKLAIYKGKRFPAIGIVFVTDATLVLQGEEHTLQHYSLYRVL